MKGYEGTLRGLLPLFLFYNLFYNMAFYLFYKLLVQGYEGTLLGLLPLFRMLASAISDARPCIAISGTRPCTAISDTRQSRQYHTYRHTDRQAGRQTDTSTLSGSHSSPRRVAQYRAKKCTCIVDISRNLQA